MLDHSAVVFLPRLAYTFVLLAHSPMKLIATFPVPPQTLYESWINPKKHSAMTGAKATGRAQVGAPFTAWDGYISGRIVSLTPNKKIVQSWRSGEFPKDASDSTLTITFKSIGKKTQLTLVHEGAPKGQAARYRQGWKEFYFQPMKTYFASFK